jgi:predicted  nucleic acid-binding Zn-ribbon protein
MSGSGGTRWATKIVLVVLAALSGIGAWYAKEQQPRVAATALDEAAASAGTYVQEDLTAALKRWSPGDDPARLRHQLESSILADADVTAVRLFDTGGTRLFSSVAGDDATIDPSALSSVTVDGERADVADAERLRTYAPVADLVGEVEQDAVEIRDRATLPWMVGQFTLVAVAVVLLGGAMFAGNGGPRPERRATDTRAEPVKQTKKELDGEDPELQKLRSRAEKAEHSRRAMEDQLNVLRAQILSGDAGSQARIVELEGHLQDAHGRVTAADEHVTVLSARVSELEAATEGREPAQQRSAALETEVATSRARIKELEAHVHQLEARAAHTETTTAAHSGQLDEAHTRTRQAELQIHEAVDRALVAERALEELRARVESTTAAAAPDGDTDEAVRRLTERLADAESRASAAEHRASRAAARATELASAAADPQTQDRVRELELALADARAAAWAAQGRDDDGDGRSLGIVETHAVPEDEDEDDDAPGRDVAGPAVGEVDEADAIRHELQRMAEVVEHAGEAGDVDGLRDRLTKSAARKKGRSVGDERIARSS